MSVPLADQSPDQLAEDTLRTERCQAAHTPAVKSGVHLQPVEDSQVVGPLGLVGDHGAEVGNSGAGRGNLLAAGLNSLGHNLAIETR